MRELNKNCVYDLSDLTSEERKDLLNYLKKNFNNWYNIEEFYKNYCLHFSEYDNTWYQGNKESTHNAKELFYTLENVQVDCSNETEERIKEMADVYISNGYKYTNDIDFALRVNDKDFYLQSLEDKEVCIYGGDPGCTTITYDKFIELFGDQISEVGKMVEKPKHYSKGIDTFARMEANCTKEECLAFAKGNIDKYNFRDKGQDLEDYKKIISYANWAIKLLEND